MGNRQVQTSVLIPVFDHRVGVKIKWFGIFVRDGVEFDATHAKWRVENDLVGLTGWGAKLNSAAFVISDFEGTLSDWGRRNIVPLGRHVRSVTVSGDTLGLQG